MNQRAGGARALILAGGLGTRLRPLTDTIPKCLVPIDGRPLLDYWIVALGDAGIREARVNTHAHADQVRTYIGRVNARGRLRLAESYEPALLGSAGTVAANPDLAEGADEVVIVYADNFSDVDLRRMLAFHRSHDDPFTMLLFRAPDPRACGIAELDGAGRIVSFVEKPREPKGDLANAGVYVVSADAYREIVALGAFDLGYEVIPRFVGRMRGWAWDGYHLDIGNAEALEKARRDAPALRARAESQAVEPGNGKRPAVFLDRDGTLIEQVHYLSDPGLVRLLPGAGETLRRLREAGFATVLVTNQSAIGRGLLTESRLHLIHDEMNRQLAAEETAIDAIYFCPEAPTAADRTVIEHGDRKPGPGMLLRAAAEMGLDLGASWMVGDMISDVLAGINAGCRGSILVRTGKGLSRGEEALGLESQYQVADDLLAAVGLILTNSASGGDDHATKRARTEPSDTLRELTR
jgi:D,D-heptose 1,7-bisphosphate phosphatase